MVGHDLLVLHVGAGEVARDGVPSDLLERRTDHSVSEAGRGEEIDEVPDAGAPLKVAFSIDGDRPIVDVIGLTTVMGLPALIPHALKPAFDEDRRRGVPPDDYRFTMGPAIPRLDRMEKSAIRQCVKRCRDQIATEYKRLHGEPPLQYLLIETKPSRGYRLDPTIIVVRANRGT